MKKPKHHFVPKWYLKGFVNKQKRLIVYDIKKEQWREQIPRNVMSISGYYRQDWAPPGIDPDVFEKALARMEDDAKYAFDTLLKNAGGLTQEELAAILVFMEFQWMRVPRQAAISKEFMEKWVKNFIASQMPDVHAAVQSNRIRINVKDRQAHFLFIKATNQSLAPYLMRMEWEIISAPQGVSFVTTDSPVTLYNPGAPPPNQPGIGLVGSHVLFPLSSRYLLVLSHPEFTKNPMISPTERLPRLSLPEEGIISITSGREYPAEGVHATNKIMIALANDIVVGNDREMILNNLDLRNRKT